MGEDSLSRARISFALVCILMYPYVCDACTSTIIGREATTDGSVIVTSSADADGAGDFRFARVPAADYEPGSLRPIWPDLEGYPRFVGKQRGPTYFPENTRGANIVSTEPIGFIPQVLHTHAYMESGYGVQNEYQVSIGETTCSAIFKAVAINQPGGTALLSINELSHIALERCQTAREAVLLMGKLAEEYGFYGADGGAGETLNVGDPQEAFVFHILADPTGKSAIWVAKRVDPSHVTVVANMFTIRDVDLNDKMNFLGSSNMFAIAKEYQLWDERERPVLDFTRTFSAGEYESKYYSGRRMWGFYRLLKPSLNLPAEYNDLQHDDPFPWSVVPDAKVDVQKVIEVYRYHYEGTPYSTTVGLAAGPYGTPDRYQTVGAPGDPGMGAWERTIGIYRTVHSYIIQARGWLPNALGGTVWWGAYDADKTVYVPVMVGMGELPTSLIVGDHGSIDRRSAFWAHRYVGNLAQMRYRDMIKDIRKVQLWFEAEGLRLQQKAAEVGLQIIEKEQDPANINATFDSKQANIPEPLSQYLQMTFSSHTESVVRRWWTLADEMMVKYADGYISTGPPDGPTMGLPGGYPITWLESVGFTTGPRRLCVLPSCGLAPGTPPPGQKRTSQELAMPKQVNHSKASPGWVISVSVLVFASLLVLGLMAFVPRDRVARRQSRGSIWASFDIMRASSSQQLDLNIKRRPIPAPSSALLAHAHHQPHDGKAPGLDSYASL